MEEDFTNDEEKYILLAFYLGRQKLLNCIALKQITKDLILAYEQTRRHTTTKYCTPINECCLCHEKEAIFKDLWVKYREENENPVTLEDVDKAWVDVLDLRMKVEEQNKDSPSNENLLLSYQEASKEVLASHNVNIQSYIKEKYSEDQDLKNWMNIIEIAKSELDACMTSILEKNGSPLDLPVSKRIRQGSGSFISVYLTLLVKRKARVYARNLQECRKYGIQIAATIDPIAVVAKYMVCDKCMGETAKDHHCILEVLTRFREDLGNKDSKNKKKVQIKEPSNDLDASVGKNEEKEPSNDLDASAGKEEDLKESVRKSKRTQMCTKEYGTYVYDIFNDNSSEDEHKAPKLSDTRKRRRSFVKKRRSCDVEASDVSRKRQLIVNSSQKPIDSLKPETSEQVTLNIVKNDGKMQSDVKSEAANRNSDLKVSTSSSRSMSCPPTNVIIMTTTRLPSLTSQNRTGASNQQPSSSATVSLPQNLKKDVYRPLHIENSDTPRFVKLSSVSNRSPAFNVNRGNQSVLVHSGLPISNRDKIYIPASSILNDASKPGQRKQRSLSLDGIPQLMQSGQMRPLLQVSGPPGKQNVLVLQSQRKPMPVLIKLGGNRTVQTSSSAVTQTAVNSVQQNTKKPTQRLSLTQVNPNRTLTGPQKLIKKVQIDASGIRYLKSVAVPNKAIINPGGIVTLKPITPVSNTVFNKIPTTGSINGVANRTVTANGVVLQRFPLMNTRPVAQVAVAKNLLFKRIEVQVEKKKIHSHRIGNTTIVPLSKFVPEKLEAAKSNNSPTTPPASITPKKSNSHSPFKTPVKKKVKQVSKSVPRVIAEYIKGFIASDEEPKSTKGKRKQSKVGALIPIPYESHYLCINDTIQAHGWRAYWYRKCRCSRYREKKLEATSEEVEEEEHNLTPEEVSAWMPKELSERSKMILEGHLDKENEIASETEKKHTECDVKDKSLLCADASCENISSERKTDDQDKTTLLQPKSLLDLALDSTVKDNKLGEASKKLADLANVMPNKRRHSDSSISNSQTDYSPTASKRLKVIYRRDKNGNWTSSQTDSSQQMPDHNDSVVFNIENEIKSPAKNVMMEDRFGITTDHGLMRSARATMVRRKALVARALDAQLKYKADREKSAVNASRAFMFTHFADPSLTLPSFDVVLPHPTCFKDYEETKNYVTARHAKRGKEPSLLSQPPDNTEANLHIKKKKSKLRDEQCLMSYINSPSHTKIQIRKKKLPVMKTHKFQATKLPKVAEVQPNTSEFKGLLVDHLENLWNKGRKTAEKCTINYTPTSPIVKGNKLVKMKLRKFHAKARKSMIFKPILEELACYHLQTWRGRVESEPSTNLISEEEAEYVASAVRTIDESGRKLTVMKKERKFRMPHNSNIKSSTTSDSVKYKKSEDSDVNKPGTSKEHENKENLRQAMLNDVSPQPKAAISIGNSSSKSPLKGQDKSKVISAEVPTATGAENNELMSAKEADNGIVHDPLDSSEEVKGENEALYDDLFAFLDTLFPETSETNGDGVHADQTNGLEVQKKRDLGSFSKSVEVTDTASSETADFSENHGNLVEQTISSSCSSPIWQEWQESECASDRNLETPEPQQSPSSNNTVESKGTERISDLVGVKKENHCDQFSSFLGVLFPSKPKSNTFNLENEMSGELLISTEKYRKRKEEDLNQVKVKTENAADSLIEAFPRNASPDSTQNEGTSISQEMQLDIDETPDLFEVDDSPKLSEMTGSNGKRSPSNFVTSDLEYDTTEIPSMPCDQDDDMSDFVVESSRNGGLVPYKQDINVIEISENPEGEVENNSEKYQFIAEQPYFFGRVSNLKMLLNSPSCNPTVPTIPTYSTIYRSLKMIMKQVDPASKPNLLDIPPRLKKQHDKFYKMSYSFVGGKYTLSRLGKLFNSGQRFNRKPRKQIESRAKQKRTLTPFKFAQMKYERWIAGFVQCEAKRHEVKTNKHMIQTLLQQSNKRLPKKQASRKSVARPVTTKKKVSCNVTETTPKLSPPIVHQEEIYYDLTPEIPRGMLFSKETPGIALEGESDCSDCNSNGNPCMDEFFNEGEIAMSGKDTQTKEFQGTLVTLSCKTNNEEMRRYGESSNSDTISNNLQENSEQSPGITVSNDPASPSHDQNLSTADEQIGQVGTKSTPKQQRPKKKRLNFPAHKLDGSYWSNEHDILTELSLSGRNTGLPLTRRKLAEQEDVNRNTGSNKRKFACLGPCLSSMAEKRTILEAERKLFERWKGHCFQMEPIREEDEFEEESPLQSLFSTSLNVERIRSWMWDSTSAKPLRLYTYSRSLPKKTKRFLTEKYDSPQSDSSIHKSRSENVKRKISQVRRRKQEKDERQYHSDSESNCRTVTDKTAWKEALETKPYVPLVRCSCPIAPRHSTSPSPKKTFPSPRLSEICVKKTSSNMKMDSKGKLVLSSGKKRVSIVRDKADSTEVAPKRRLIFSDDEDDSSTDMGVFDHVTQDADEIDVIDISEDVNYKKSLASMSSSLRRGARLRRSRAKSNDEKSTHINQEKPETRRSSCSKVVEEKKIELKKENSTQLVDSEKIQALRESVFAEIKNNSETWSTQKHKSKKVGYNTNPGKIRGASLLRSKWSTKGSFISRLLECDGSSSEDE